MKKIRKSVSMALVVIKDFEITLNGAGRNLRYSGRQFVPDWNHGVYILKPANPSLSQIIPAVVLKKESSTSVNAAPAMRQ